MLGDELGTLATFNPRAIAPDTSVDDVLDLMHRNSVRHLPVVNEQRTVVGMVSDLDLLRHRQKTFVATGDLDGLVAHETVDEIMTRDVACVEHNASPRAALSLIVERRIHSVPVIEDGKLRAVVSSTDFLREFSYGELKTFGEPVLSHATSDFDSLEMDAAPEEATRLMDEHAHDSVVVLAGQRIAGVITRREILTAQENYGAKDFDGDFTLIIDPHVGDLVPSNPPVLRTRDTLGKAAVAMVERRVKAIPVLRRAGRNGELVGLLEERTILAAILAEIS